MAEGNAELRPMLMLMVLMWCLAVLMPRAMAMSMVMMESVLMLVVVRPGCWL